MRLLDLPNEILYLVADNLSYFDDLSRFTLTSRSVHALLTDYLYRRAARDIQPGYFPSPALIYSIRWGLESSVVRLLKWTPRVPANQCRAWSLGKAVLKNKDPGIIRLVPEHWGVSGMEHRLKGLLLDTFIKGGTIEMVRLLLEFGCDANEPDYLGEYPLATAIDNNLPEIVMLLLDYGADINCGDLVIAALDQAITQPPHMIELLVRRGADINFASPEGNTTLHCIASQPVPPSWTSRLVGVLADNGANLQARNKEGKTALEIAVERGNSLCQASLLDAMPKSQTSRGP
ncbi:hypothetical protein PMG11_01351 [Penicillium brasilianum]|uniref:F-box domain-containing protein n=1 Tax=Penicillium brasilianum TaxID=104259 RepID=A0A0F7TE96_PENBI|nr:hypothetical protein PMG11_01351 [Penicillium brasilianum]